MDNQSLYADVLELNIVVLDLELMYNQKYTKKLNRMFLNWTKQDDASFRGNPLLQVVNVTKSENKQLICRWLCSSSSQGFVHETDVQV